MFDPVSASSPSTVNRNEYNNALTNELGKDAFLRLLVTQLNYQDPLSPMQNEAFVAQLAQFSALEQMQNINRNLEDSIQANFLLNKAMNNSLVTTLIGKDVVASTDRFTYDPEGNIELGFRLSEPGKDVKINIYDEGGKLVRTLRLGFKPEGEHFVQWDGLDMEGKPVASGEYRFEVEARTTKGKIMEGISAMIRGQITGVKYEEGTAILLLGTIELSLGDVQRILQNRE